MYKTRPEDKIHAVNLTIQLFPNDNINIEQAKHWVPWSVAIM